MRTVKIVFQDCPFCGARKAWGDKQQSIAKRRNIQIEKVSFVAPEAKGLMESAAASGIKAMPFFTDGKHFVKSLEDLPAQKKPAQRKRKKITKKKEELNGDIQ